eukprot:XP_003729938.1 PREDICTED: WD repeat-containing and planar cell polarity effector protein fritz homolog [Strongylocentrotus purpuratus]
MIAALETSLGSFYAPLRPLSEVIVVEYRDAVSRLARRFFQFLLRYQRFEKAFLLAVDLHSRDLFMDIHHLAIDKGEMALANVAKQKAEEIELEMPSTSGTDDYDSEDSLSEDDVTDGSYSTGEERHEHERNRDERRRDDTDVKGSLRVAEPLGHLPQPVMSGSSDQGHVPAKTRKSRKDVDAWHRAEERIDEAYRHGDDVDESLLSGASGLAAIPGDIYTRVLTDNPFGWDTSNGGGSSASHPSRGAGHDVEEGQEEAEVEETTTLKVVHFGMV